MRRHGGADLTLRGCIILAAFVAVGSASTAEVCDEDAEIPPHTSLLQTSLDVRPAAGIAASLTQRQQQNQTARKQAGTDGHSLPINNAVRGAVWAVMLVCFLGSILLYVFLHVPKTTPLNRWLTPHGDRKTPDSGRYMRCFLKHKNHDFGKYCEHAFRGAVTFVVYALPFFIQKGNLGPMDRLIELGLYTNFIGQQILFNYQATVGATIRSAAQLLLGTSMAVLSIWLLMGVFPDGVAHDQNGSIHVIGLLWGSFVILGAIWLNLPMKVTIFFLCRFSEFWMAFLNPTADVRSHYSVGFQVHFTGTAMKSLLATMVGSILALVANMVPFPSLSIFEAEEDLCKAVGLLKEGWKTFHDFMQQPKKREDISNKMQRELFEIKTSLDHCRQHVEIAWWECIGRGPRQRQRLLLTLLCTEVENMYLQLLGAVQCCTADETFSAEHMEIMTRLRTIRTLIDRCGDLFFTDIKVISDPNFGATLTSRTQAVSTLISVRDSVSEQVSQLSAEMVNLKEELALPDVSADLLEEYVFVRSVCAFGRTSADLASKVIDYTAGRCELKTEYNGPTFSSVYDMKVLQAPAHVHQAARLTCSFFVSFAIGFFGFKDLIAPYNVTVPCTMALLIAPSVGISLVKNLTRLQGVVLGTAVGVMIHATFNSCGFRDSFFQVALMFIWIWLNLTGFFSGKEHAYFCFILAIFAQNQIVKPCGTYDPETANFKSVFAVIAAIGTMLAVDMCSFTEPASRQAAHAIDEIWSKIMEAFQHMFNPDAKEARKHTGELIKLVMKAIDLGEIANTEPRFWKTAWRLESFRRASATMRLVRCSLHTVEQGLPDEVLTQMLTWKSLKRIYDLMETDMKSFLPLSSVFLHDESSPIEELEVATKGYINHDLDNAIDVFAKEANTHFKTFAKRGSKTRKSVESNDGNVNPFEAGGKGQTRTPTFEDDSSAKICHVISMCQSVQVAMRAFKSSLVLHG